MEITIKVNNRMMAVEVSAEVAECMGCIHTVWGVEYKFSLKLQTVAAH